MEGSRVALISHSIISNNPGLQRSGAGRGRWINVIDNDQPGLDIQQLRETSPNTFVADTSTEVLEDAAGFSDAYSVTLTAAPTPGETVTVTLSTNTQITAVSKETGLPYLTFTSANWNVAQIVLVNAVDDPLDGVEQVTVTHHISSSGGKYSAIVSTDYPKLAVTVYDNETPGVVVQETDGSTTVVENGAEDSYRVRLTSAPVSDVTLTIRTDMQTMLSSTSSGFQVLDETGAMGYFEMHSPSRRATGASGWMCRFGRTVCSEAPTACSRCSRRRIRTSSRSGDRMIIEGGVGSSDIDRSLRAPVLLPDEINV